jgi:hypothetical protein
MSEKKCGKAANRISLLLFPWQTADNNSARAEEAKTLFVTAFKMGDRKNERMLMVLNLELMQMITM